MKLLDTPRQIVERKFLHAAEVSGIAEDLIAPYEDIAGWLRYVADAIERLRIQANNAKDLRRMAAVLEKAAEAETK